MCWLLLIYSVMYSGDQWNRDVGSESVWVLKLSRAVRECFRFKSSGSKYLYFYLNADIEKSKEWVIKNVKW